MRIFAQICLGTKNAHDRSVIHRDIKSLNILMTKRDIIKISDFGISKILFDSNSFAQSRIGSTSYLSPEILKGNSYNTKTDIWSLGILLFELIALSLPFVGASQTEAVLAILNNQMQPLPEHTS